MKVLFVSAPQGKNLLPVIPIGLLYIADVVKKSGYETEVLDLGFSKEPIQALSTAITEFEPEVVGISIRNVAETDQFTDLYQLYRELVQVAKEKSVVILGGAGFSIFAEEILKLTEADFGIVGEGEEVIIDLLHEIKTREVKSRKKIFYPSTLKDFTEYSILETRKEHWDEYGRYYALTGGKIPIQASRGCKLRCKYCSYPQIHNHSFRKREAKDVVEEMVSLSKLRGVREAFFVDAVFNFEKEYLEELLILMEKRYSAKEMISWQCCVNPSGLDLELAMKFLKAGCTGCDLGVDSFSDQVLQSLGKQFNAEQALAGAIALEKAGIPYSLSLILGGPGEDEETLQKTVSIVESLNPTSIHAFIGVRIYPETKLHSWVEALRKKNLDKSQLMWASDHSFYVSPKSKASIKELVESKGDSWKFSNTSLLKDGQE